MNTRNLAIGGLVVGFHRGHDVRDHSRLEVNLGRLVILREKTLQYLHVHPRGGPGPDIRFCDGFCGPGPLSRVPAVPDGRRRSHRRVHGRGARDVGRACQCRMPGGLNTIGFDHTLAATECLTVLAYVHMSHGVGGHVRPARIDGELARVVAERMQVLAAPSRVQILGRLKDGPCAVGEIATAVGMEPSAVSHQLRQLRYLGLVVGKRQGRRVIYALHDSHVAELLDQAVFHVQHLRLDARLAVDPDVAAS
jgi:ArsR family transcriptional regulator, nickel/cobalt-responsive transcriptional repressor